MDSSPRPHMKKKFTPAEDLLLRELVQSEDVNWSAVASHFSDRTGRQCRDRWVNYVNPSITNSPWSPEEERTLEEKFRELGPHWIQIAAFFPRRSASQIKNHWITKQRRLQKVDKQRQPEAKAEAPRKEAPKFVEQSEIPEAVHDLFAFDGKPRTPWDDFF